MRKTSAQASCQVLDPRSLGRPVHLLGSFAAQMRQDLATLLRERFNRRYHARFEVRDVRIAAAPAAELDRRWLVYGAPEGRLGFSLDRSLLLCFLGYRYGIPSSATRPAERETSTEERLAMLLGRELTGVICDRIRSLSAAAGDPGASAPLNFQEVTAGAPAEDSWLFEADIAEGQRDVQGTLRVLLHEPWSARLIKGIAHTRPQPAAPAARPPKSFSSQLKITLNARLLEKDITIGTLCDLKVGDVLPVSLGASEVLAGDSPLFRAALGEHQGKLWLTGFEDVE